MRYTKNNYFVIRMLDMRLSIFFIFLILFCFTFGGCRNENKSIEIYRTPKMVLSKPKQVNKKFDFTWVLPKNWRQVETGAMRLASFEINKAKSLKASLSALGGDGGGLENNIKRWQGQLGLGSKVVREKFLNKNLGRFKFINLENEKSNQALSICVFDLESQTLYTKLEGELLEVSSEKDNLIKFCKSLNHAG